MNEDVAAMTFGRLISEARRRAGLSQKDLAARIKKEDGSPISPQYLNDLERDRRNPPNTYLLHQFSRELAIPEDYLFFVVGQFPPEDLTELERSGYGPDQVLAAFQAFRKTLRDPSS